MKTLSDALFAKKHGPLTFGALIQVGLCSAENMTWAVPSGGQLINKGVCRLLSLSRAQSLQRELKRGPRGVSFGRSSPRAMTSSVRRWFGCDGKANGVFFWGTPRPAICLSDLLVVNLVDFKPWSHQTGLCFELWVLIL